jgi:peptidoglycan/LPS O-acetylase OafA/YrhL
MGQQAGRLGAGTVACELCLLSRVFSLLPNNVKRTTDIEDTVQAGVVQARASEAYERFRGSARFGSLDGLRAISILAVIWQHTVPQSLAGTIWGHVGAYGVTLFFAISGFLITTLLVREHRRNGHIDLTAFYMRRSLRIFPLYYAVLLLYVVLVWVIERDSPDGREFFANLAYFATYTSNLFVELDGRVIFYFAWSLATEEQFYLVWPPLLVLCGVNKRALVLISTVLLVLAADEIWGGFQLHRAPVAIVGGAILALVVSTERGYGALFPIFGQRHSSLACAALVILLLAIPGMKIFLIHLALVALVAACVLREDHALSGPMRWAPAAFIGSISYGMYLLHMLSANAAEKLLAAGAISSHGYAVFPLALVITTCAAYVSFRYFETPFLRLKSRFGR